MTRCLGEKALLMLSAGGGSSEQRLHVETCDLCSDRYGQLVRELEFVATALRQEPPVVAARSRPISLVYKAIPVAAAIVFAVLLIWGETRLWQSSVSRLAAGSSANDMSDFIEQVSEALFPAAFGQTEVAPTESDLVSLQNALGENCAADCQELFGGLIDGREGSSATNK